MSLHEFDQSCQQILADLPADAAHKPRSVIADLVREHPRAAGLDPETVQSLVEAVVRGLS